MRALAVAAALAAAACSRSKPPAPPSGLHVIVNGLAAAEPCGRSIPSQWSPSWPVPVAERGSLSYRVFFFGRDGDLMRGFRYHQAEGDAEFAPDGKVLSCARRARPGEALPAETDRTETLASILEKEDRLYALTEDVAVLFAAGKPLSADERKRVADFSAAFGERIVPGHAAAYRAMSPGFWTWVEGNGGRAPAS